MAESCFKPDSPMERVKENSAIGRMLDWCQEREASDLHGQADKPYCMRRHGKLSRLPLELFPLPANEQLYEYLRENFAPATCARIETGREIDLSFYYRQQRYRANFSKQK